MLYITPAPSIFTAKFIQAYLYTTALSCLNISLTPSYLHHYTTLSLLPHNICNIHLNHHTDAIRPLPSHSTITPTHQYHLHNHSYSIIPSPTTSTLSTVALEPHHYNFITITTPLNQLCYHTYSITLAPLHMYHHT